jgi:hypothetical protein
MISETHEWARFLAITTRSVRGSPAAIMLFDRRPFARGADIRAAVSAIVLPELWRKVFAHFCAKILPRHVLEAL